MNKRETGERYEQAACDYLRARGVAVLEKNFSCRQGEIDIIGRYEEYLIFAEVKYRTSGKFGTAEAAVTTGKQKKICRVADYYRFLHGIGDDNPIRYDVIAIQKQENGDDTIKWYQNAFCHIYTKH